MPKQQAHRYDALSIPQFPLMIPGTFMVNLVLAQSNQLPLATVDMVVLIGSVIAVTLFGMYVGRKEEGTSDYYLAGKSVAWWAVAGSIFGTNVSSHHMVGMMGAGLKEGFAQANYEFGAICGLMMLCYFFLPLYRRMGVYTLSEFLGRRFDDRCLLLYSLTNIAFLLIQMCGTLILGAVTVEALLAGTSFPISYTVAVIGLSLVAALYTVFGGLKAVIYTDFIQSVLLIIGSAVIAVLAIWHPDVGGISGLLAKEPTKFHVFFPADHEELPWTGVFTGLMILHFYYWGTNQYMVQRALGARTGWDGRMGIILAGFFKLLIPFMCIVPGMAAAYILKDIRSDQSDTAFAALTRTLVPAGYGLTGLVMAGLVGGILSTIDSMMNSTATLFTFDIYKKYLRPNATEQQMISVGRVAMCLLVVVAIGLSLLFGGTKESIFNKMAGYNAYLVPGVLVAFLAGIFQRFITPTGAVACIITGLVSSIVFEQFSIHMLHANLQQFHRAGLATVASYVVIVIASLLTQSERNPTREQYLWWTYRHNAADEGGITRAWWQNDATWACVLVACTVALCVYFA